MALISDYTAVSTSIVTGQSTIARTQRLEGGEEWLEYTITHSSVYLGLTRACAKNFAIYRQNIVTSSQTGVATHYFHTSRLQDSSLNVRQGGMGFQQTVKYDYQESQRQVGAYEVTRELEMLCQVKVQQSSSDSSQVGNYPAVSTYGGIFSSWNQTLTVTKVSGSTGTAYLLKFLNADYPGEASTHNDSASFDITITQPMIVWVAGYIYSSGTYFNGPGRLMFFEINT